VFVETLVRLSALVKTLRRGDAASLLERWRQLAPTARGSLVKWDTPAGSLSGTAAGIDDRGALLVRVEDRVERIVAGEVTWL
jgi:biotin-(acetyl-CoA carboxylase) ligase